MFAGKLSRRTVLRGVGAALGLPWLEAMGDPSTGRGDLPGAARPLRFAALYMANGVNANHWTPKGTGRDFVLSEILAPLEKLRDEILVPTQLWNQATNTGDGHYVKTGGWLTSTTITRTTGSNLCAGNVSMDQVIARKIGNQTRLPSLELGIEPVTTGVDTNVGFTRLYGSHISWSTPTTPLNKEINPRLAFDRLFRVPQADSTGRLGMDASILDQVSEDARRLSRRLGRADQLKLGEYLESVRAVEQRIEFDRKRQHESCLNDPAAQRELESLNRRIDVYLDPAQASERGGNHTEHVRLMLDILALAFWTDSTRVGTFMFANAVSGRNFSFLDGVKGSHHELSHHENDAAKLEQYKRIGRWHVEQYAYFLNRLAGYREGEGTVLDRSMILFGAGLRDGHHHNPHNLPLVVGGRGGGSIGTGRHIESAKDTPMANLHLALIRKMGVKMERFADSTEELRIG